MLLQVVPLARDVDADLGAVREPDARDLPQRRGRTLALRWLVTYSRDRREKQMDEKLAGEILDALNQQGLAFKRKDDLYRMAQANKAFAHYRW